MADRLYTTKETDEILSALRLETRLEKYIIARMAFSLSIVEDGKNVPSSTEFSGSEMKRPTFIGQDELFIRTLISQVYGISDISEVKGIVDSNNNPVN
ncbi:MAG: DndE family protein [Desulfamplus sp.]|nr:DndE family protein [Desulfamplus sp.]